MEYRDWLEDHGLRSIEQVSIGPVAKATTLTMAEQRRARRLATGILAASVAASVGAEAIPEIRRRRMVANAYGAKVMGVANQESARSAHEAHESAMNELGATRYQRRALNAGIRRTYNQRAKAATMGPRDRLSHTIQTRRNTQSFNRQIDVASNNRSARRARSGAVATTSRITSRITPRGLNR